MVEVDDNECYQVRLLRARRTRENSLAGGRQDVDTVRWNLVLDEKMAFAAAEIWATFASGLVDQV